LKHIIIRVQRCAYRHKVNSIRFYRILLFRIIIELEGGKVADSYGEEINRLTDELDEFESKYGFDGHKRQIEKQQKEIINEILDLISKEL